MRHYLHALGAFDILVENDERNGIKTPASGRSLAAAFFSQAASGTKPKIKPGYRDHNFLAKIDGCSHHIIC
jgi:hypothetical protein